jgi:hypothetical protein
VRRVTGEQLYVKLVTDERVLPEAAAEDAQAILSAVRWCATSRPVSVRLDSVC